MDTHSNRSSIPRSRPAASASVYGRCSARIDVTAWRDVQPSHFCIAVIRWHIFCCTAKSVYPQEYLVGVESMSRTRKFASKLGMVFDELRAARTVAAAMEAGRRPPERAIRTLGLDESIFNGMYR